jgi:uncharacterized protein with NRDE domain
VCLLVVAFRLLPGIPILIGANRDEFLNRPAVSMTMLRPQGPRVLGGLDQRSGGTWLAINEHGVYAGLTNQPQREERDPSRRTRGELPLALTAAVDARTSIDAFLDDHRPADYNGSWLLAGDRDSMYYIDFTGLVPARAVPLPPGLYVLENRPLGAHSPKAERVAAALASFGDVDIEVGAAIALLHRVLADHTRAEPVGTADGPRASTNCVHLGDYGTRSSCIIRCDETPHTRPRIWVADGPPCTTPFADVSALWTVDAPLP